MRSQLRKLAFLFAFLGGSSSAQVLINETNSGTPDYVELGNCTVSPVDISGWTLQTAYAAGAGGLTVEPGYTLPGGTVIPPGGYLVIQELGSPGMPGSLPGSISTGFNYGWTGNRTLEVWLVDGAGVGIDYMYRRLFANPVTPHIPPGTMWSIDITGVANECYRGFDMDTDSGNDWVTPGAGGGTPSVINPGQVSGPTCGCLGECTNPQELTPLPVGLPGFRTSDDAIVVDTSICGTSSGTPSCNPGGNDSFVYFIAPFDGSALVDTCSTVTNFNTVLAVYEGGCTGTELDCNDDSPICGATGTESTVAFTMLAGVGYFVLVDGFGGATGMAEVRVRLAEVPLDYVPCTVPGNSLSLANLRTMAIEVLQLPSMATAGGSVAYQPCYDQYYAFQVGALVGPFEVFDGAGVPLQSTPLVGLDGRGIWHNPTSGNVEMVTFDAMGGATPLEGLFAIGLDSAALYDGANVQDLPSMPGLASPETAPAYDATTGNLYSRARNVVLVPTAPITAAPALPIPDGDPLGVSTIINVPSSGTIADLDVAVNISHTWTGDVSVSLTHVPSGTMAVLLDRPRVPLTTFGCQEDDIDCLFDDSAPLPAEGVCDPVPPAIGGPVQPQDPLSIFNGIDWTGDWELFVSDAVTPDSGTLNSWGLTFSTASITPSDEVNVVDRPSGFQVDMVTLDFAAAGMPPVPLDGIAHTGVFGYELAIGLTDSVLFFDRYGDYAGTVPLGVVVAPGDYSGSFANDLFWTWDGSTSAWRGFDIFDGSFTFPCSTAAGGDLAPGLGTHSIDTDTGFIDGMPSGAYDPMTGHFNFVNIDIQSGSNLVVLGSQPLVLIAAANVNIGGNILAGGGDGAPGTGCNSPGRSGGAGGPGGGAGGNGGADPGLTSISGMPGQGPGGGVGGTGDDAGGGGGGFATNGGDGLNEGSGTGGAGGRPYNALLPTIVGGSGGGGGSADDDAPVGLPDFSDDGGGGGGGGGGAIVINASGTITVGGSIDCSGGRGGSGGVCSSGSGGGGSGGSISLLAAVLPTITGTLDVSGGAGDIGGADGGDGSAGRIFLEISPCGMTCMITPPASPTSSNVRVSVDALTGAAIVDYVFDFSTDGGATFAAATAAASSPLSNPALGVPVGMLSDFVWNSYADAVPMPAAGVILRATAIDGSLMAFCETGAFAIDCACGDCNLNGVAPEILDSLIAAQIAAGITPPAPGTLIQQLCCDTDATLTITVLDSLKMAQGAAGIPVMLNCP